MDCFFTSLETRERVKTLTGLFLFGKKKRVWDKRCSKLYFLLFVKPIKAFDEKYFEFSSQNKEIVFFWTEISCKKCTRN